MTVRDRLTGPLAALATILTLWSMRPVVEGARWVATSVVVVLLTLAVGAALRWARVPAGLVLLGQAVVAAVVLTVVFAGPEAVLGLVPGPDAFGRFGELLRDAGDTVNRYSAPVPSSPGIDFMVSLGVAVIALAVDSLAVSLRSPAAAGLPLLALYCVPAAVVPDGLPWRYFAVAAVGWLLLLAHDAGGAVTRWGRLLPRWGGGAPSRQTILSDTSALAATGRRLGVVAVLAAVLVPAVLPGLPDGLLTRGGTGGTGTGTGTLSVINPVLQLRDNLSPRQDVEVLRYTTTQTAVAPLRIVTADTFDGETWKPGTTDVSRRNRAAKGLPNPPGLTDAIARQAYTMRIDVSPNLDQDFLPLPYPARKVDIDGAWLYDAASLNVLGEGETVRDKSYSVDYLDVTPTADQLRAAPAAAQDTMQRYVRLPSSLPDVVRQRALEVTQGASTAYDQAMALQEWFRSKGGFTYSTQAPADSGGDAVADFLQSKQGFCIQFASAMATMSRSLGIPARIGVGFLPGTPDGQNTWSVRLTDAHAWPELYFEGVGWVRFEPTPATRTGAPPAWAAPATTGGTSDTASTSGATDAATGSSATSSLDPRLAAQQARDAAA
ncbi:transglutaminase family protein, partial [Angustibacter aerolatus]